MGSTTSGRGHALILMLSIRVQFFMESEGHPVCARRTWALGAVLVHFLRPFVVVHIRLWVRKGCLERGGWIVCVHRL